jgi:hypothetical protein
VEGDLERNEATPRDAKTVWEPKAESERSTAGGELLRWKTAKRSVGFVALNIAQEQTFCGQTLGLKTSEELGLLRLHLGRQ